MSDSRVLRAAGHIYAILDRVPLSMPLLIARIATFSVFLRSGLAKLSDWNGTLMLFRDEYRVPVIPYEAAAYMAAGMELGCSTLILLGLLARISILALFGMIATIQIFVYPGAWPDHIQWIGFMLFLLVRGPGALSMDNLINRQFSARSKPSDKPLAKDNVHPLRPNSGPIRRML